jgi:hydrogenase maturation protease
MPVMNRMKTLVLGLGNPILRDDAIGLRVVRALQPQLERLPDVDFAEDYHGGLRLMERMIGYDRAIIVDAICSGSRPGTVLHLGPEDIPTQHSASTHDVNLPTAMTLGYRSGAHLPALEAIRLVAVEAVDVLNFGEDLTPEVEAAIPGAMQAVLALLHPDPDPA